jgi:RNA polymerase sigma factor (sigma-70 family)
MYLKKISNQPFVQIFKLCILQIKFHTFPAVKIEGFRNITDPELLDRFYADKNNEWLGLLLERYTLLLFGVCLKYLRNEEEAKDSVQQIFLKAITELHKYKVEYFKSWIYMVARNHCLMMLRDRHGRIQSPITDKILLAASEENPKKSHIEKEDLLDRMGLALLELNKEQKQCLTLFYLEKKTYQEVAEITGFTPMQVKSHIQNGKRNLKILLEK